MEQPFSDEVAKIADGMGVNLYQQFSVAEAALFLRIPISDLETLQKKRKISYIQLTKSNTTFFGFQLVEYLVEQVQAIEAPNKAYESNPERIIDTNMVQELTGLSRSTLWRLETRGEFPRRVSLSTARVGWRYHEIIDWLNSR